MAKRPVVDGIVVEKNNGELKGLIYLVTHNARILFYDRDGETRSMITL